MHDFADEEGLSQATEMAGRRIREAIRILHAHYAGRGDVKAMDTCDEINLEMTRIYLFMYPNLMSEDMMRVAQSAERRGDTVGRDDICREIVRAYGTAVDDVANATEFSREHYETLAGLEYAYRMLSKTEPCYLSEVGRISKLLSD